MPAWPSCMPESWTRPQEKRPWGGRRKGDLKPPHWVGVGRFGLFGGQYARTLRGVYGVT